MLGNYNIRLIYHPEYNDVYWHFFIGNTDLGSPLHITKIKDWGLQIHTLDDVVGTKEGGIPLYLNAIEISNDDSRVLCYIYYKNGKPRRELIVQWDGTDYSDIFDMLGYPFKRSR